MDDMCSVFLLAPLKPRRPNRRMHMRLVNSQGGRGKGQGGNSGRAMRSSIIYTTLHFSIPSCNSLPASNHVKTTNRNLKSQKLLTE